MTARFALASIVLFSATLDSASAAQKSPAPAPQSAPLSTAPAPVGPTLVNLLELCGQEYDAVAGSDGAIEARTPELGLSSRFEQCAVRVESDASETPLRLSLEAWGRGDALAAPRAAEPHAVGRRVEYRRGPLTEWYVNGRRGLQQGFTVDAPPEHARDAAAGALKLVLSLGDELEAVVLANQRDARFVDTHGAEVFTYSGLQAWDDAGEALAACLEVEHGRLTIQVDDSAARYPITIDPWIATHLATLSLGAGASTGDSFGFAVDISGDVLAVGVPNYSSSSSAINAGAVFIYSGHGDNWSLQASWVYYPEYNAFWGTTVAAHGDTVLVGAASSDTSGQANSGNVIVIRRTGGVWSQEGFLTSSTGPTAQQYYGNTLAVHGDTLVIGGGYASTWSPIDVWRRAGGVWSLEATLAPPGVQRRDMCISGDTIAFIEGANVRVFTRSGSAWTQQQVIAPALAGDFHLALEGDRLVCCQNIDINVGLGLQSFEIRAFNRTGGTWALQSTFSWPHTSGSGSAADLASVGMSGDMVSLRGWGYPEPVFVFRRSGVNWSKVAEVMSAATIEFLGRPQQLDGQMLVTGAAYAPVGSLGGAGKVYVHRVSQASCPQHFNHLSASDAGNGISLDNQDGWVAAPVNTSIPIGVAATLGFDGSPCLRFTQGGPGVGCDASRKTDSASPIPQFDGTETDAYVQADMYLSFWGNRMGLAYDLNDSGHVRAASTGEVGPTLQIYATGGHQCRLSLPDGTSVAVPFAMGSWMRMRLVMDLSANSGVGSGSVFARNLSAGATQFTPVAGLQNIPLGLDNSNSARNPDKWDALFLHFEGTENRLDNFVVGHSASKYDFECLPANDTVPFEPLLEGGWVATPDGTSTITGVAESGGFDGTACLRFQAGAGTGCDQSLVDGPWSVPVYSGTESATYFQFDARVNEFGVHTGVAADIDGSGHVEISDTSERGVELVLGSDAFVGVQLKAANGGVTANSIDAAAGAVDGDWVRVRVVMNLAANSGAGAASVYAMNLTAGHITFSKVAGLQDIPLALNQASVSARDPRRWNAVFSRFEGTGGRLDNLEFAHGGELSSWSYCTAGVTTNACQARMWSTGTPSVGATIDFVLRCSNVEGQKSGLLFYGITGPHTGNWNGTSVLCVKAPLQRLGAQNTNGTANSCTGEMSNDWSAYVASHPNALGVPFSAGQTISAQAWFRDPPAVKTTNLSDALEFVLVP